jgi:hypothetical protein
MRNSALFAVLLCVLVSVCEASDQPRQFSSSQAAVTSFDSDRFDSAAGIVHPDGSGLLTSDRADSDRRYFDPTRDRDVTCYTVQSYLVKRQSPGSDAVEPVGYSTCQQASRYSVKKTEGLGKALLR